MQLRNSEFTTDNIKYFLNLLPGTIVNLTFKLPKCKIVNKDFKVEKDYGAHILFTDIHTNRKLSITKIDFITDKVTITEPNISEM